MAENLKLSEDLEKEIISHSIKDVQFFLDIQDFLKKDHFENQEIATAWYYIQQYFNVYHSVPTRLEIDQILKAKEIDVGDFLLDEENTATTNRDWLLDETIRLIRHQEFKKHVMNCAEEAGKEKPDFDKLEEELKAVLSITPMSDLGTSYFDLDERFLALAGLQQDRIKTGIEVIDDSLEGGLADKELVGIGAPSGVGKSYILCIAGANMLIGERKNVLHYTFEMSEERTSLRYDMAILNMTKEEIFEDVELTKSKLSPHKIKQRHLYIKEFPTRGANANTLRTHMNKLREQKGFIPDVVIIDYGDIMKAISSKYSSKYDEQGAIFQELRGLAQEFNVPILTATQTNRGSVGKAVIGQEDMADSYDKARIMDALFTLVQRPEDKEDGLIRIFSAKNRNNVSHVLSGYKIDYAKAQLEYIGRIEQEDE
jgi:replicative DNA helicase